LGLSGVALVGLVYFEGMSARAEVEAEAEDAVVDEDFDETTLDEVDEAEAEEQADNVVSEANPVALPPSGPAVAVAEPAASPAAGQLALATVAGAAADAVMPVDPPAPALVAVPDIEGMSLRKAKKALAAAGLKMSVRDEYGEKIPREYWSEYKVRKQKLDAGAEVEAGSTVKVKARYRVRISMGY
jgi:hypothetical protein